MMFALFRQAHHMKKKSTLNKKHWLSLGLACVLSYSASAQSKDSTRLMRFADIHKDQVTFIYSGDVYVADINSGVSKRLTAHKGFEAFPKFSRDGKKIAFTAEYTGSRQVYVMNADGSDLKQLTWYNDVGAMPPRGGYDYRILDWSADDKNILVRANRLPWGIRMGQPYFVPVDGGMEKPLPIPEAGGGMLSPDGKHMVFTPKDREFRTWKRYRGGRAQDVWTYDLENNSSEQLTTNDATDHQPVWVGDDIYFISDRDYHLNLYKYVKGGEAEKVTHHDKYDALWASAGPEAIVYENGGYLWRYDTNNKATKQLAIHIPANQESPMATRKNVKDYIESMSLSPDGKRVVVGARGDLFSVPAKNGEIKNLTQSGDSREMNVTYSPDGKRMAYLSDASGEYEIYLKDSKTGKEKQLSKDGTVWRFAPVWSPDGKKLAYSDKDHKLWTVDASTGKRTLADSSEMNDITDYSWSPDSNWLVYTKGELNGFSSMYVHNLNKGQSTLLSDKEHSDFSPVFGSNGDYLFFLSNRDYNLAFSSYEFNHVYNNATRVYAAQLNNDSPELFPYTEDGQEVKPSNDAEDKKGDDKKSAKAVNIEFKGFNNRVVALTSNSGNFNNLQTNGKAVFVIEQSPQGSNLKIIDLSQANEVKNVAASVRNYQLSAKGDQILLQAGNDFAIVSAAADQKMDNKLDLTHLTMKIDPKVEWMQMYTDAWRIARDWFYDPNMHGMDWDGIREKYKPMAEAATHRTDLDYVLSEIAGEMNAGHIYVNSGDQPSVERQENGLLGAEFKKHKSGFFEITKIMAGENWNNNRRSPLTESAVDAKVGDFIIAINGNSTKNVANIYQMLEHSVGRTVDLTINSKPQKAGARVAHAKPIASESQLRYLNWVNERRAMVDQLSGGRIGYVHLPNTAVEGNRELTKQMLPQIAKDALIIDDRYNGGGFIPDRMIELLSRKTLSYWKRRSEKVSSMTTPMVAHDGPKVMLANGMSSSGGDALPYFFKKTGLGKVIGTRTWGGLIGISGNPGLVDGGSLLVSTFRFMDTDGNWAVENEGVSPDIEVIDRPELVAAGKDPSIERAVEELLKALEANPRKTIKAPEAPSKF